MDIQKLKGRNGGKPNSYEMKVVRFLIGEVRRVSGIEHVRLADYFINLGLNSIQKRDICVSAEVEFGADVSPKEFCSAETVGDLAQYLINNLY